MREMNLFDNDENTKLSSVELEELFESYTPVKRDIIEFINGSKSEVLMCKMSVMLYYIANGIPIDKDIALAVYSNTAKFIDRQVMSTVKNHICEWFDYCGEDMPEQLAIPNCKSAVARISDNKIYT